MARQEYDEDLPAQCPPNDTLEEKLDPIFRLVPVESPDESSFASFMALDQTPPPTFKGTACEWASCSLNVSVDSLLKMRGLAKRNPFVAQLAIPASTGRHNQNKAHVNFWKYKGFQLSSAVVKTWEHGK